MLLSIVVPVYNSAKYLKRCLDSVVNQTFTDFEIIIIDDSSNDDSFNIARQFQKKDKRIKLHRNTRNRLAGYCRNKGLSLSSGKFVWFVDSDDWLPKDAVSTWLEKTKDLTTTSVIIIGFFEHYKEGKPKRIERIPMSLEKGENAFINFLKLTKGFYPMPFIYIFSKEFLLKENIKFSVNTYYEDILFTGKTLLLAKKISMVREPLYYYNKQNEQSITQKSSGKKIIDLLDTYHELDAYIQKASNPEKYRDLFLIRFLIFGLGRALYMYSELPANEKKDENLISRLIKFRKFSLLKDETLHLLHSFSRTFNSSDKIVSRWYSTNLDFLLSKKKEIFDELELLAN